MYLTREEERILREGGYRAVALETVIKVGEALGADRLLDVDTAHISGVSYLTIGDAGLEYLRDIAEMGARFRVFTTVNPAGIEYGNFNLPVERGFVERQMEIINHLLRMGASLWLTCTPYEFLNIRSGTIHAWGESNAIAYINSVKDAYSEKLPGPFTIMAAIAGKVPRFGLYIFENRIPTALVKVEAELNQVKAGILGRVIAQELKGKIPLVDYNGVWSTTMLKAFLASYATYSPTPLAIIKGVNPNWALYQSHMDKPEVVTVSEDDLKYSAPTDYDAVLVGCPHAGLDEVMEVVRALERHGFRRLKKPLIISTSRFIKQMIGDELLRRLNEANVIVVADTCPMVSPLLNGMGIKAAATPSSKATFYLPRLVNVNALPCSIEECVGDLIEG